MLTFLVDLERLNLRLIFLQKIKFALWIQIDLVNFKLLHVLFISSDVTNNSSVCLLRLYNIQ